MCTSSARSTLPASSRVVATGSSTVSSTRPVSAHMDRFHRLAGDRQHRAEAAGAGVVIQVRHHRPRIGLERHQRRREAGHLDVAIRRRAAADQRVPHRIQHVLAPQRTAGPFQHRAIRRRCGPPVDAELPRDGAKLRRLHDDAPARAGAGTQHALGIRAGVVEQVRQLHHRRVQRRHRAQRRGLGASLPPRHSARRQVVIDGHDITAGWSVSDSISSLAVITLLFIS